MSLHTSNYIAIFNNLFRIPFLLLKKRRKNSHFSVISRDTTINGDIESSGTIILFGKISGKVICKKIYISKNAVVGMAIESGAVEYVNDAGK